MQVKYIGWLFNSSLHDSIIATLEQQKISIRDSFFSTSNPLIIIYFNDSISAQIKQRSHIEFIKKESGVFHTFNIDYNDDVEDFSNCFVSIAKMFI